MEFNLDSFLNHLVSYMATAFPFMLDEEKDRKKHPNRQPLHAKEAIFDNLQVYHEFDTISFNIGNERLEKTHTYYHILEDSEVIRKRNRGTTKSRGSQAKVQDKGKRDYGRVSWNGKTYTKEYSRNVRGSRSLIGSSSHWVTNASGQREFINRDANYYANIHYKYIERMLENGILDQLAQDFGLTRRRTEITGLEDEFQLQTNIEEGTDPAESFLESLSSFESEEEDYD